MLPTIDESLLGSCAIVESNFDSELDEFFRFDNYFDAEPVFNFQNNVY